MKLNHRSLKAALTSVLFLIMFAYGLSITLIGPLLSVIVRQYSLTLPQGGLITSLQYVGGVLAILIGAFIADRMKKSRLILASVILYSLSLLLLSKVSVYAALLGLFFLLGAGTKMIDVVVNAYMSDLHSDNRGRYLNTLHAMFGLGATVGPLYSNFFADKEHEWRKIFLTFGIVCAVISLLYILVLCLGVKDEQKIRQKSKANILPLLKDPKIYIFCLIMFLYMGHQSGATSWAPMYMEKALNADNFMLGITLSSLWVGILIGRIICIFIVRRFRSESLILFGSLIGGISLTLGVLAANSAALLISLAVTGLFTGALIPLLMSLACGSYPDNTGTVSSMIVLSGSIAGIIFPWIIGIIINCSGYKYGMLLTGIVLIIITCFFPLLKKGKK